MKDFESLELLTVSVFLARTIDYITDILQEKDIFTVVEHCMVEMGKELSKQRRNKCNIW